MSNKKAGRTGVTDEGGDVLAVAVVALRRARFHCADDSLARVAVPTQDAIRWGIRFARSSRAAPEIHRLLFCTSLAGVHGVQIKAPRPTPSRSLVPLSEIFAEVISPVAEGVIMESRC